MKPADASKTSNACCGFCNTLAVAQVRLRVCACNLQEAQSLDSTLSIPQDAVEFGVCSARGDPIYSLCIPRTSLTTEAAVLHTLPHFTGCFRHHLGRMVCTQCILILQYT